MTGVGLHYFWDSAPDNDTDWVLCNEKSTIVGTFTWFRKKLSGKSVYIRRNKNSLMKGNLDNNNNAPVPEIIVHIMILIKHISAAVHVHYHSYNVSHVPASWRWSWSGQIHWHGHHLVRYMVQGIEVGFNEKKFLVNFSLGKVTRILYCSY